MFDTLRLAYKTLKLMLNEKKSREEIEKIRDKKLRKILKFAYKNTKFYREYYNQHGISYEDLETIPIDQLPSIDKRILIDNFDDVVTDPAVTRRDILNFIQDDQNTSFYYRDKYQVVHSSGSSGDMGIFIYSKKEIYEAMSCSTRMRTYKPGKTNKVVYFGAVDGRFGGVSLVRQSSKGLLKFMYDVCYIDLNSPLDAALKKINGVNPDVLIGYGGGLTILAKSQQLGSLNIQPRIIVNGGEGLTEADYKLIKETFNVPIVNMYASSECYYLGLGREEYEGIYLMDDFNYIEVMEDHILVTNLYNRTQPIIRYRIDDQLVLKEDHKKLLPFTLVDNVIGRDEMTLWFNKGNGEKDYIHPSLFNFAVDGLEKYQILYKSEDEFEFLAINPDKNQLEKIYQEIKIKLDKILEKKGLTSVKYKISELDSPILDKRSRKFRMILKEEMLKVS